MPVTSSDYFYKLLATVTIFHRHNFQYLFIDSPFPFIYTCYLCIQQSAILYIQFPILLDTLNQFLINI